MSGKNHVFDVVCNLRNSTNFTPKKLEFPFSGTLDPALLPVSSLGVRFAPET
jgi:hypothetical protein